MVCVLLYSQPLTQPHSHMTNAAAPRSLTTILLLLGVLSAGWSLSATAQQAKPTEPAEPFDPAIHLESFDQVWNTIKKVHWQPEKVGKSWDEAKATFRPKVESAKSIQDVRVALSDMLNTLDQSHFGIIPNAQYEEANEVKGKGGNGTAGIEIRLIDGELVVTRVFEDLPASKANIQPGWQVKLIGNRTAEEILTGAKKVGEQSVLRLETATGLVCDARTSGDVGEKLALAFVDNDDKVHLEYLELAKGPGKEGRFGNLPPFNVTFEEKLLPDDIGYIAFNSFLGGPQMAQQFADAVSTWQKENRQGLIIDLRGNRGGLMLLVNAMCGWLTADRESIGTMTMAGGNFMKMVLNPRRPKFDKPVAVLTDGCSISAAEVMAGGIKDLGLGRIFGSKTAGLVLPSTVVRLPNGDGFQYALSSWESASGESIEGIGVIPDEEILLDREMLSKHADPVLSAARKWILEENKN